MMFNATEILIADFVDKIRAGYHRTYGGLHPEYEDIIGLGWQHGAGKHR